MSPLDRCSASVSVGTDASINSTLMGPRRMRNEPAVELPSRHLNAKSSQASLVKLRLRRRWFNTKIHCS